MFMYPEVLLYICIHSRSHVDAATAPVTYFGDRRDRCPYLRGYSSMALNSSYSILPELSCRGNARDVKAVVAVLVVAFLGAAVFVVAVLVVAVLVVVVDAVDGKVGLSTTLYTVLNLTW